MSGRGRDGYWRFPRTMAHNQYTDEQAAWLKAIDRWRARHGRYPSMAEAFHLAIRMGYRRVTA